MKEHILFIVSFLKHKKRNKGSAYLINVAGLAIVIGVIILTAYKYNFHIGCDLLRKHYDEFSFHIFNAFYVLLRLDEGEIHLKTLDNFQYILEKDRFVIVYKGHCKIDKKRSEIKIEKTFREYIIPSIYEGSEFCAQKVGEKIMLCNKEGGHKWKAILPMNLEK